MNARTISSVVAAVACASASHAAIYTLTFEGVPAASPPYPFGNLIGNFYNGGGGATFNYGVTFATNAYSLKSYLAGGPGNFKNEPSSSNCMTWDFFGSTIMNVAAGFTGGFATYYSSIDEVGSIEIYSGLDGTGVKLATLNLAALGSSTTVDTVEIYDNWALIGTSFVGEAKSVVFAGEAGFMAFDNVTFGSAIPAPGAIAMLGAAGLITSRRRR